MNSTYNGVPPLFEPTLGPQCQCGLDTFLFTGRKDSAEGTLPVYNALRSFSIHPVLAIKQTDANKLILN